jgi:hypothetical protein
MEKKQKALGLGTADFIDKALFNTEEKELIKNKMKIAPKTPLFRYVVLKRKGCLAAKGTNSLLFL